MTNTKLTGERLAQYANDPLMCISDEVREMAIELQERRYPVVTFYSEGIAAAANWVDQQREFYDNEHGRRDNDTGSFEFGNDAQREYSDTLAEIAEGIRALHPSTSGGGQERRKTDGAEPIGWTDAEELRSVEKDGCGYLFKANPITPHADPLRVIKLYAVPQSAPERDQIRREHAEWADITFGNIGPVGPLKHLSQEALEAAAAPGDLSEWADMQFLLWDAQRRAGYTDEQITKAMVEKLAVNKARQWPEPKDGEPRLHIKENIAENTHEPYVITVFKSWLAEDCIVLDTETTGLGNDDEIVEISMMTASGVVLLDTLVKPTIPIPEEATKIHGITNEMVASAPYWSEIHDHVMQLMTGRPVVIYNSALDVRMIFQTAGKYYNENDEQVWSKVGAAVARVECAMFLYAAFWGVWNSKRDGFRWQRLEYAAEQQGVIIDGTAHRALCDVKTTLGIIQAVAAGGRTHSDN